MLFGVSRWGHTYAQASHSPNTYLSVRVFAALPRGLDVFLVRGTLPLRISCCRYAVITDVTLKRDS